MDCKYYIFTDESGSATDERQERIYVRSFVKIIKDQFQSIRKDFDRLGLPKFETIQKNPSSLKTQWHQFGELVCKYGITSYSCISLNMPAYKKSCLDWEKHLLKEFKTSDPSDYEAFRRGELSTFGAWNIYAQLEEGPRKYKIQTDHLIEENLAEYDKCFHSFSTIRGGRSHDYAQILQKNLKSEARNFAFVLRNEIDFLSNSMAFFKIQEDVTDEYLYVYDKPQLKKDTLVDTAKEFLKVKIEIIYKEETDELGVGIKIADLYAGYMRSFLNDVSGIRDLDDKNIKASLALQSGSDLSPPEFNPNLYPYKIFSEVDQNKIYQDRKNRLRSINQKI
jgi:hypothetical protein